MKKPILKSSGIAAMNKLMIRIFAKNCDNDVITITDIYIIQLLNYLGYRITDDELNDYYLELGYWYIDRYKVLRETYQMLCYHYNLYIKGSTTRRMFLRVCGMGADNE